MGCVDYLHDVLLGSVAPVDGGLLVVVEFAECLDEVLGLGCAHPFDGGLFGGGVLGTVAHIALKHAEIRTLVGFGIDAHFLLSVDVGAQGFGRENGVGKNFFEEGHSLVHVFAQTGYYCIGAFASDTEAEFAGQLLGSHG